MNKRQERVLEVFLFVTFAIALVVGVGSTKGESGLIATGVDQWLADAPVGYAQGLLNDDEDVQLQSVIRFGVNEDTVNALGRRELLLHANVLRNNPHLILNIIGHADRRGSELRQPALSEKRARQVYELLLAYGAAEEQLIVDSYGESNPVQEAWKLEDKRCVELQYLGTLTARTDR